jgi:hypothetical protein
MRTIVAVAAAVTAVSLLAGPVSAKKRHIVVYPVTRGPVMRSASGTPIQATRTILHNPDGTTTIIVTPQRRSYLDPGTEVLPGEEHNRDYMLPPGGDPGRSSVWFYGPDMTNALGGFSPAWPGYLPGYNPYSPF